MTKGIVIYAQDYKEYDALIHILCEDKIVTCICKGVLKINSKNKAAIQLFSYSDFEFVENNKAIKQLKSARSLNLFTNNRSDLLKQTCALYVCECIDKSGIIAFDLLYQTLKNIEYDPYSAVCLFQALINEKLGIQAYVDGCVDCFSKTNLVTISLNKGGFLCQSCFKHHETYDLERLKKFRIYSKAKLEHYDLLAYQYPANRDLFDQFYLFFKEYSGLKLKTYEFLKGL